MASPIALFWFRQDLRLTDNPGLYAASEHGHVLPIYILDDVTPGPYAMGAASRVWLHHSLNQLNQSLDGALSCYRGQPLDIISRLIKTYPIAAVYWNRCYEPWRIKRDKEVKQKLNAFGIEVQSYNGSLLWEPWSIKKSDGTPYKVFTPFYRKGCLSAEPPRTLLMEPKHVVWHHDNTSSLAPDQLELQPKKGWNGKLAPHWTISEKGAHARFQSFLDTGLTNYTQGRNEPAQPYVSRLSPYLHFGQISPNQLWYGARLQGESKNIDHFCSELGWREFSHSLLYYNPRLPEENLQAKFDAFPWRNDAQALNRWQRGQTGVPMVDAGMRELWQTGYMHNRVRMIVGSFLVKNLRLDWRHGARWFWDCLFDADLANNSASWQWVAGCGADAAPYFRIFNPVTQGQKFDPKGAYIRKFLPELAKIPDKFLFNPWNAPKTVLDKADVVLGITYPAPLVDLAQSRREALDAFQGLEPLAVR